MTDRRTTMTNQDQPQSKRERQRAKAEAKREAERRAQQRRTMSYALGGLALIVVVVIVVVAFMGGRGDDGVGPSAVGDVTVQGPPLEAPLAAGDAVPAYTAPELAGGTVSWDRYVGKPVVLPVWAPWCSHCQAELPVVDRVMQDYPDVELTTVVTSIGDQPGPSPDGFMKDHGLDFPVAVDDENGTLAAAFGIRSFPTLFFVNSDGTVAVQLSGEVEESTLRSTIESLT
jgi:thiol-disulfide isomerase/thioredoxin